MFRFIVIMIGLVIYLVTSIPIQGICCIIALFNRKAAARLSLWDVQLAFRLLAFIAGVKTTYVGRENIPDHEAVLYVMNHRSYFDIIVSYTHVKGLCGYISKDDLKNVPSLSWWMRLIYCEFMDRKDIKKGLETINRSAEKIKKGISMCVCPEGTRNKTDAPLLEFKGGALKIAEKAECKIVPVVVNHTDLVWEKQFPKIKPTKVIVEYLPPIDVAAMDKKERKGLTKLLEAQMSECYLRNENIPL